MFLIARPGLPEDLPQAFVFIRKLLRVPDADAADLQAFWRQILAEGEYSCNVLEDSDRPAGERVVAHGLIFCAPDSVVDYALKQAPPFLWRWTLERWRRGEKVWLGRKEARQAQTEGPVSVLAFLAADAFNYPLSDLGIMGNIFAAISIRDLAGFHLRHFVAEAQGMAQRDRYAGHGMRVLSDFGDRHRDDAAFLALPPQGRPFLMGADLTTINQDLSRQDSALGRVAMVGPPRYGFSEAERDLMRVALHGLTDQAIAEKMGLSLVTIKKRWESIYAKVRERAYEHALELAGEEEGAKIGRRQVIQMVTEHPEEFRPSPPKRRGAE